MTENLQDRTFRFVVAGSVVSTERTLRGLVRNGAHVVGVLGLAPEKAKNVSAYVDLGPVARALGLEFAYFKHINDGAVAERLLKWQPDFLFVVGLSQMVDRSILQIPRVAAVGFHPTLLPQGRGRAPIAWLVIDSGTRGGRPGAATFFVLEEGVDSGPILAQEPFLVGPDDYAEDVTRRQNEAIDRALDKWIPRLLRGEWQPAPQDERYATWYGRRASSDGHLDFTRPAAELYTLVRAASRPHPGAYTYVRDWKLVVWRAEVEPRPRIAGVPGRILAIRESDGGLLVQCGEGALWLTEFEFLDTGAQTDPPRPRVGMRLGYCPSDEIWRLRRRIRQLEERMAALEAAISKP